MPVNILTDFRFRRDEVMQRLAGRGGVRDYLATRWLTFSPGSETWVMWDLALILALARPELATEARAMTPPENAQREIHVYTGIDRDGMLRDWWRVVEASRR
jgi:hypothetical protein